MPVLKKIVCFLFCLQYSRRFRTSYNNVRSAWADNSFHDQINNCSWLNSCISTYYFCGDFLYFLKHVYVITIYEKASGSKVNYENTKGIYMYIGSAKNNRPKYTKIVWTKDNAKTLGIHHGYNIHNDEIWKSIIV